MANLVRQDLKPASFASAGPAGPARAVAAPGHAPADLQPGDLTDPAYWEARQTGSQLGGAGKAEWLAAVEPYLRPYAGQRLLELGCSPGHASAAICQRVPFQAEGVDFSPAAGLYLANLRAAGVTDAVLHQTDLRTFAPPQGYDVVASFGLVEHFRDPGEVLAHHDRLLRGGGLCVVVLPNLRKLQYAYHYLFDRPDLRRHNVAGVGLERLARFAAEHHHRVLFLGHVGQFRCWNVDTSGPVAVRAARRALARLARELAAAAGRVLPADHPWWAPWLVYAGQKYGEAGRAPAAAPAPLNPTN